jgi:hypothetical protein
MKYFYYCTRKDKFLRKTGQKMELKFGVLTSYSKKEEVEWAKHRDLDKRRVGMKGLLPVSLYLTSLLYY